jgi:hypothetical protein
VLRVLDRYLVEVVEAYDLCPWARPARLNGELAVGILWGEPALAEWIAAAEALLARRGVLVAMVVAPEFSGRLRDTRDRVCAAIPSAGVADFYPDAPLDLSTPARLVPYLRRSPDPLLQLVPLALLDAVRGPPPTAGLARQAQILGGRAAPDRGDVADRIAADNHARVSANPAALAALFESIAADRARSYARVGISVFPRRR